MKIRSRTLSWCLWIASGGLWIILGFTCLARQQATVFLPPDSCAVLFQTDSLNNTTSAAKPQIAAERGEIDTFNGNVDTQIATDKSTEDHPRKKKKHGDNPGPCVNVNTAFAAELTTLEGVGPVIAERVIECRNLNGPFKESQDLRKVKGIGQKRLEKIIDRICF